MSEQEAAFPASLFFEEIVILVFKTQQVTRMSMYFQANDKVIINHVVTNQDLCVEEEICQRTSFGTREYEITAHTMLDSHRAEKEPNHWMIVMGVPGDNVYPVLEQSSTDLQSASS